MFKLILADGTELPLIAVNGTNFVSETEIDEELFDSNLSPLTVVYEEKDAEGNTFDVTETIEDAVFIQQVHYDYISPVGYYLAFRERTEAEKQKTYMDGRIEYLAMMTDVEIPEEV